MHRPRNHNLSSIDRNYISSYLFNVPIDTQMLLAGRLQRPIAPSVEREHTEFGAVIQGQRVSVSTVSRQSHHQRRQVLVTSDVEPPVSVVRHERPLNVRTSAKRSLLKRNKPQEGSPQISFEALELYYRYQAMSLLSLLGRRDQYFSLLRGKPFEAAPPYRPSELKTVLVQALASKGRDSGRQKFSHLTNQQLRSLKYRGKLLSLAPLKAKDSGANDKKDDSNDEEEEDLENPVGHITQWRRMNGLSANKKIFIIKGGYHSLREALYELGWRENQDVRSQFFDFKWTTKIQDVEYGSLKSGQHVNHFNNNHHLTSKYGLSRRLRTLVLSNGINSDLFYPRCFDLGDQSDFENFIEDFKISYVQSLARRYATSNQREQIYQLKQLIVDSILKRRTKPFIEQVKAVNSSDFSLLVEPTEWAIITASAQLSVAQQALAKQHILRLKQVLFGYEKQGDIRETTRQLVAEIDKNTVQNCLNGQHNVWIAKPNFLSRGRGIRCFDTLFEIIDYCLGKDAQFVVQKYIEKPLLIGGRKFDIRQWVLIEDFSPPVIWFYDQCYLRFCCDDFSLDNLNNRFVHLTNNSVQKHNKKAALDESMWHKQQFIDHVGLEAWKTICEKLHNIVVWSIKSCEGYVTSRRGSCQLVGYDFMFDESFNPWLIEVNMSPSMDLSTPVTKRLVPAVLKDTAAILVAQGSSSKFGNTIGGFTCIYRSQEDQAKYQMYRLS